MSKGIDLFLSKTKLWKEEMVELRTILLNMKLEESIKWGKPCYSYNGSNIVILQPFKSCLGMMFFKGTLLKDTKKILVENGPNSQAAKRFEFRSVREIAKHTADVKAYIKEAVALEESGQKVEFNKKPESIPEELKKIFSKQPKLKKAFGALTPGRQRAYLIYFSGAKQSATRQSRIEKCIPQILDGKGIGDR